MRTREYVNKQNLIHDLSILFLSIDDYRKVEQFILNYETVYIDNDNQVRYNNDMVENDRKGE